MTGSALAAGPGGASVGGIYSCITPDGRKVTSDRPIAECSAREQRMLNNDGSLRKVIPPVLTADERAEKEARDRKAELDRLAQLDAIRRDRHLVTRYPDEASHQKSREAALDTVRLAMKASEKRMEELAAERKPLLQEAEFYAKAKQLPAKLKQQLDANDAAVEAQRSAIQNQQAELERINRLYDNELARLKRLWAGAAPGTLADGGAAAGTPNPKKP
jgi:LmbE family N-acetylglucosaminyl deacetylase